jgi:hypothetical protein
MKISLVGKGAESLLPELDSANIQYEHRPPRPGVVVNAGLVIEIAGALSSLGVSNVLVQWLKGRASREVSITDKQNKVFRCQGYSVKEVETLLAAAQTIMAYDPKPPTEPPSTAPTKKRPK